MNDPGQLTSRLTIQQLTGTRNPTGELLDEWADIGTVWAEVQVLSGREFFAARQVNSQVTHRIRIRHNEYTEQITPEMRMVEDGTVYEVLAVLDPGPHDLIEVLAMERQ